MRKVKFNNKIMPLSIVIACFRDMFLEVLWQTYLVISDTKIWKSWRKSLQRSALFLKLILWLSRYLEWGCALWDIAQSVRPICQLFILLSKAPELSNWKWKSQYKNRSSMWSSLEGDKKIPRFNFSIQHQCFVEGRKTLFSLREDWTNTE